MSTATRQFYHYAIYTVENYFPESNATCSIWHLAATSMRPIERWFGVDGSQPPYTLRHIQNLGIFGAGLSRLISERRAARVDSYVAPTPCFLETMDGVLEEVWFLSSYDCSSEEFEQTLRAIPSYVEKVKEAPSCKRILELNPREDP